VWCGVGRGTRSGFMVLITNMEDVHMSGVSTQQAQMTKNIQTIVDAPFGEPVNIQTPSGMCSLFNTHLVSQKLIGIIGAMLNLEEWSCAAEGVAAGPHVMSIVFRADGLPVSGTLKRVYAISHCDTQSFAVNLLKNFEEAIDVAITKEPTASIRTCLWHELLTSIAHEMHHVASIATVSSENMAAWTEDDVRDEEAKAVEWARTTLMDLATSDVDIEPPTLDEEPLFQMLFMAENLKRLAAADESTSAAWDNQLLMLTNSWAWHDPKSGYTCDTFADWMSIEEVPPEQTILANQVHIVDKATGEEHDPRVEPTYSMVPTGPGVVMAEAVGPFAAVGAEEELPKVALWDQTVPAPAVETVIAVGAAGVGANTLFSAAPGAESDAQAIAEAMELAEQEDGGSMEGEYEYTAEPDMPAPAAPPVTRAATMFTTADEVVPGPAPAPEPEVRQAYDPNTVAATAQAVFTRCFQHIFTKCMPVNGVFQNPTAVYEPINISDIPGSEIVVGCDTIDAQGRFKKRANVPGWVKGTIFTTSKLPAFHIYLNVGGVIMERRLVPQNVNKTSKPAESARAGNHIGWIIDAAPQGSFVLKYENGQLSSCKR
jgi:hypothetical protein